MGEAGVDFMNAGAGADTMIANDGERDTIDCGTNPAGAPDSVDARRHRDLGPQLRELAGRQARR